MGQGDPTRAIRFTLHPTRDGSILVVLGREWMPTGSRDREFYRVTLPTRVPTTGADLGATLRAASDALADAADRLQRPA